MWGLRVQLDELRKENERLSELLDASINDYNGARDAILDALELCACLTWDRCEGCQKLREWLQLSH